MRGGKEEVVFHSVRFFAVAERKSNSCVESKCQKMGRGGGKGGGRTT